MRYIPTFRFPVSGFFVNTSGNVMNRPPSCGQHFKIGKSKRLTSLPFCITSLHGPLFTLFGKNDPSSASFGSILTLSKNPCGVSIFRNPWMRCATSSSSFTSNASAIRRTLPNALINKGYRDPFGFSNSSAGLPPGGTGFSLCPPLPQLTLRPGAKTVARTRPGNCRDSECAGEWQEAGSSEECGGPRTDSPVEGARPQPATDRHKAGGRLWDGP